MYDPQFSWAPVPGATKYEVEVNSSVDFAPGSKVCCSQLTTATNRILCIRTGSELSAKSAAIYQIVVFA